MDFTEKLIVTVTLREDQLETLHRITREANIGQEKKITETERLERLIRWALDFHGSA